MDSTAFNQLKADFLKARTERGAAVICSVGVALSYLFLLVLLYLFVDLLVTRGYVPSYSQFTHARQREFADEWERRPEADRAEAVKRVTGWDAQAKVLVGSATAPAPTAAEWELRWRAGAYLALKERVGQAAADAYLPERGTAAADEEPRLGALGLIVRERNGWAGKVLGSLASWNPWMWRPSGNQDANPKYLAGLFVLAFTLCVLRGIMVNALAYVAAAVTLDLVTRLRRAVFLHTYRLGSLLARADEPEHLFTRHADTVGSAVNASLLSQVRAPLLVAGLIVFILLTNLWLAVSFLLMAALLWLVGGQYAAHVRKEGRLGARQAETSTALMVESLGLLRMVKCYRMDRFNQNRVERQLAESGRATWRRLRGTALIRPLLLAVALVGAVALLYLGGRSVLSGEFSVAGLVVMAVALASLMPPIADWFDYRLKLRRGREAAAAIGEFLGRKGESAEAPDAEYLPALTTKVEFRGVRLDEPGGGRRLLENVTFTVPAGSRVAIVGTDPDEKRALVDLLPRYVDPTAGEIRIEDKNIRWVTHESLRAQVVAVMQNSWIFTDTVVNNIGCGDQQFTMPQIIEAAKLAHAHSFIEVLPHGYETVVGEHGHALKVGEQFRLSLARALLRDPSILIIEEPAGTVDEDTLALLDDTLERAAAGRTLIFLANRLSTLQNVDRVFLLKEARLVASGTHAELWETNEHYRRLQMVADSASEVPAGAGDEGEE
ncbi:abc transporter atp-binding protein : ABC-type multidrug transport system, ATPase and permease component OS=Singulisphaera acidiphila (strain ATCC BAA-1392 / DSM 18658 / VKM B-2454 / MOB10) GN=Sinac_6108 PE=4 SV=1: ABC_membrane: ABC_tran [Gemmataceae bacterium]|nr:abc transporter atp-binding protein : ABC-type multidrug transport system, ATPase and permease component OS=Singulisphaera acidiphila (strain ATCC BAA-1392 / DSM 18658 / VKM B-2454 / MOB10) GN=Sinac_6108 PE=4 SV=1: ABC_membrane: ABC_tran [Gemmataceae bacterium]VTT98703.1 abc transporter atp-binding protein : ABC-type multidrug transport system, ATPase and permease component OS=Singulisphaera acidiphila (strain ATCC BAA-1392 / DSM 18658 / VKM B-2454 / MOB10) GN=Sinac_6108 PE=4 SV=1: ABC_membrane